MHLSVSDEGLLLRSGDTVTRHAAANTTSQQRSGRTVSRHSHGKQLKKESVLGFQGSPSLPNGRLIWCSLLEPAALIPSTLASLVTQPRLLLRHVQPSLQNNTEYALGTRYLNIILRALVVCSCYTIPYALSIMSRQCRGPSWSPVSTKCFQCCCKGFLFPPQSALERHILRLNIAAPD